MKFKTARRKYFPSVKGYSANLPPVFSMDMNNLAISEKTPIGSVIYSLEGSDPENGTLKFQLNGTDSLHVDPTSGDVTVVKPLDYETNDTLNLIVSVEDEANPESGERSNVVSVPITVIVLDENDEAPEFRNKTYEIQVSEDTPSGSAIISDIHLMDKDSPGENLKISCINIREYPDACDTFDIKTLSRGLNSFHGALVLRKKLSYAEHAKIEFILKASDGELSNTAEVRINISDVQDMPPHFKGPFAAEVKENAPINTLVMTISAEDGDKGVPRKVVYEMVNRSTKTKLGSITALNLSAEILNFEYFTLSVHQ
ncbi:hypothetical protein WA026_016559 [Henosepilachna vigintioctopunctata]|uniref:Cadherin domain-containing protein n=1 Tax=Henosepilachna vigintioctopunctata TaxID=420089 RepID=A0AAW1V7U4_9CUCU